MTNKFLGKISYVLIVFSLSATASELDKIATTQHLPEQVQLSHAPNVAAHPPNRRRYLFDSKKANEDLNTLRAGIDRYT